MISSDELVENNIIAAIDLSFYKTRSFAEGSCENYFVPTYYVDEFNGHEIYAGESQRKLRAVEPKGLKLVRNM